jgi:hypothetical protein
MSDFPFDAELAELWQQDITSRDERIVLKLAAGIRRALDESEVQAAGRALVVLASGMNLVEDDGYGVSWELLIGLIGHRLCTGGGS